MKMMFNKIFVMMLPFALTLDGCRSGGPPSDVRPFELTDTMMKRCQLSLVKLQPVKSELRLFGKIAADNDKMAHIYPLTGGIVSSVNVELGDYVQQGQLLAVLRSSEVADFQRQLLDARADVAVAEKNLQVAKDLYAASLNSQKDVISMEKQLEKANSELARITEVYKIYHLKQGSEYTISAPISGFIVNKAITKNEEIRSDRVEEVFSIAQIDNVWVLANVNESNIADVKLGYEADVQTISYDKKIFKGKVDKIFNVIDPASKAMKILVKIENPDRLLKPEMNAVITLRYTENKSLLVVPASAIIFDKSKDWVMVFKTRKHIETRQVEVYRTTGGTTYISSGLLENEKVISRNALLVYDALND
jgi:cobalt-zinc-cadmium efflux system membrane fusion protein